MNYYNDWCFKQRCSITRQQNLIHFTSATLRLKAALLSSTIPIEILDKSSGGLCQDYWKVRTNDIMSI